jgi:predicted nucleotidyltransferase
MRKSDPTWDLRIAPTLRRGLDMPSSLDNCVRLVYPSAMSDATISFPQIRENVLQDPRYPVSKIAGALRPYLQVIAEEFHPARVILFGSYAYGEPTEDSDVDLLIIKDSEGSPTSEATRIRRALRPLRHSARNLPLDIMVRTPEDLRRRLAQGAAFHEEIVSKGLVLI